MHRGIQAGAAAIILVALVAGTLLLDRRTRSAEAPRMVATIPTASELRIMEAQAVDACRCARKLKTGDPGREACWSAFKQNVNRFEHGEWATACAPVSTQGVSFGEGEADVSLVTEYVSVVSQNGGAACTLEEARILEAVWAETENPNNPKSYELAEKRMQETVQRFIRGEHVAATKASSGGCAG